MGRRPEPCILFAQTFVHSQLDEYVDEVLFAEPVVVTACEFLEQNAPLSAPSISLVGATSPPSFAMEVFVHCEGESRFRRLCQPFLYSHSSSNVLEVEAVITNHLVVRGCYRSLTLIVYGNTSAELGDIDFINVGFDLDNSLVSLVSSPFEGKLEDLPPALLSENLTFEELILSTKTLSLPVPDLDLSSEMKQFLRLSLKICQRSDNIDIMQKVAKSVISVVSSYVTSDFQGTRLGGDELRPSYFIDKRKEPQEVASVIAEATDVLLELYKSLHLLPVNDQLTAEDTIFEPGADVVTSQVLVEMLLQCFPFLMKDTSTELHTLSQNKNLILGLNMVFLICSARESCFRFVSCGGMEKIALVLGQLLDRSTAVVVVLLGAIENATRHAIGCEGFLGWWPRTDEIPTCSSDGYSNLLKALLSKQRHDIASRATYVLQRLRFYEAASKFESAVLSVLAEPSADDGLTTDKIEFFLSASSQLKQIMRLLNLSGPIEDPSPAAKTRRSVVPARSDGILSYKATATHISSSKYSFSKWDIDTQLLLLLKERGFFPLSAALLACPLLHSANGSIADIFVDIATCIQSLLLSLLFCRSGLTFLLLQPEATATTVLALQGAEDKGRLEGLTLRQASVLMLKGFFCHPQEVTTITEIHLRVGNAIDRLLTATPHSDELLWVLWDLCTISRTACGRQALLSLGYFPEALSVLMEALHSSKDAEQIDINNETPSLSLATFHSVAEIFEVIVTDSTASSLNSWIGHAVELHKALHLSSPGSNRKDAPTRLLEWIDAGVVYQKNGAIGLLRYAAVLASGEYARLSSASVLVSESMDVENVVGDNSTNASDVQVLDNLLGKLVSDKYFDGINLRSSSIVQLTTAIRILSFISEDSAAATSLFEEGGVTLVYVVLINCKFMLEQSSNTYDYLVDEGAESNTTSELLLERIHEQNLVDLMVPSIVLLINLLRKLHGAKVEYRNRKLVNALLRLHREVSPKVAACATDYSSSYPNLLLGFGAVCHLIASALAYWGIGDWAPSLFHCLLESVQATSSLALGPKDACSMLHLLGDFLPEEGIWLWCNGMPPLSALRTLSIGTILGPEAERDVDWFLQPEWSAKLLVRLTFHIERIGQIILHFASSTLVVIQDMLRVFILRIACQRVECAVALLRPLISWIGNHINEASLSETDSFKVYSLLDFIAKLLEHPHAKTLLVNSDAINVLVNILKRCNDAFSLDGKPVTENRTPSRISSSLLSWSIPLFKSLVLIFAPQIYNIYASDGINIEVSTMIGRQLLRLCQVLPVGRELLACLVTLKEFCLSDNGGTALLSIFSDCQALVMNGMNVDDVPDDFDWRQCPPFLHCCKKLLKSLDSRDDSSSYVLETIYALSLCALCLCVENENLEGVSIVNWLFGLSYELDGAVTSPDGRLNDVLELITRLDHRITEDILTYSAKISLDEAKESVKSLLLLIQSPSMSSSMEDLASSVAHMLTTSQSVLPVTMSSVDDESVFSRIWKSNKNSESESVFLLGGLVDRFLWECPDTSADKLLMSAPPGKRKPSTEISSKRVRENPGSSEVVGSNAFTRGLSTPPISTGPSRRDSFRQRKPNTSRPPSMHVDDYVARERSIDGATSGSHVMSSSQRGGSTSGRPPSVHVDEFEARQRERQNPTFVTVGSTPQVRPPNHENSSRSAPDKTRKPRQLKADLDDDLHEIDIVFDEESGSDDKLPFPQPDDSLQTAPVINSPGSVVEETEGNAHEDVDSIGESVLQRPGGQQEIQTELSISSEKNDESKVVAVRSVSKAPDVQPPKNLSALPSHLLNLSSAPSLQPLPPPSFHQRESPQKGGNCSLGSGSQGYYEHKFPSGQPPLPPLPPPNIAAQTTEAVHSHSSPYIQRDAQPQPFSGYPFQPFNVQSDSMSLANAQAIMDNKNLWNTESSNSRLHVENYTSSSSRILPPLPPMPPPFSTPMAQSSTSSFGSHSSIHGQIISSGTHLPSLPASNNENPMGMFSSLGTNINSFPLPSFTPPMLINRPIPGTLFGSPSQQHGQMQFNISPPMPSPQPSTQSVQPQPPLPPPPQPPRPHPSQNLGIPIQVQQPPYEQVMPMQQNSIQLQMQPLQMQQQQFHIPQVQLLYQQSVQNPLEQVHQKMEASSSNQQQDDPSLRLQQFFSSPEAIQSLLSDRDKLCQLLEQHPKLMEMLQARLGQQ